MTKATATDLRSTITFHHNELVYLDTRSANELAEAKRHIANLTSISLRAGVDAINDGCDLARQISEFAKDCADRGIAKFNIPARKRRV